MREKISVERKIKCGILNGLMYASAGLICLILRDYPKFCVKSIQDLQDDI